MAPYSIAAVVHVVDAPGLILPMRLESVLAARLRRMETTDERDLPEDAVRRPEALSRPGVGRSGWR